MPLVGLALGDIFGAYALAQGYPVSGSSGDNSILSLKPNDLGIADNVTNPETLTPEGILLALLQRAYTNQGNNAARILEMTRSTPIVTTRGGDNVRGERYVVTIYSGDPVDILDPDSIHT